MSELRLFFADLLYFPRFGHGIWGTFRRGLRELRVRWMSFFFHGVVEPLILFFAFGFGVGAIVPAIQEQHYSEFLLPGLVVLAGFSTAFFEASHGAYDRFQRRVYEPALRVGIHVDEIIWGEALFATLKGLLSVSALMGFGSLLGMNLGRVDFAIFPIALCVFAGATFGVFVGSVVRDYNQFSFWTSGVVVPLVLLSGGYFPIEVYPFWSQSFLEVVPLVHAVKTVRMAFDGDLLPEYFLCIAMLILPAFLFLNLGAARWQRRLSRVHINKVNRYEYKD